MTKKELELEKEDFGKYQKQTKALKSYKAQILKHPTDYKLLEKALHCIDSFGLVLTNGYDGGHSLRFAGIFYSSDCVDEHRQMADVEDDDDRKTDLQDAKKCAKVSNQYCDDPDLLDPTPVNFMEVYNALKYTLDYMPKSVHDLQVLDARIDASV